MTQLHNINKLADTLNIHYRTALTQLKNLQNKFPDHEKYPFLHRYIGKRIRFTESDIYKIVDILSKK